MIILDALSDVLGSPEIIDGQSVEPRFLQDEGGGVSGKPLGLVRPRSTEEMSRALSLCHEFTQPVVIQGGRTGMAHAALPRDGELIISLERINAIEAVDERAGTMTLGAGCILQVAQEAASDAGWQLALDIGSRGSCTIGGLIATNAGGHQVMRHGMMRDHVLGLEAVLPDGTVLSSMRGLLKDNTGYDLSQLIAGSEGTLAVITRAVLRLRPPPLHIETALCAFRTYEDLTAALASLHAKLPGQLSAFEAMWRGYLAAAAKLPGHSAPFADDHAIIVLVESEGGVPGALQAALEVVLEAKLVADALVAQSERDRQAFWKLRDAIGPLVERMSCVEPFDVSAPQQIIGNLVEELEAKISQDLPQVQSLFFGHIGDGNLHLALSLDSEDQREAAESIVYNAVSQCGGSISAEHGIGMLKKAWLSHSRSPAEIATMRAIRTAIDPKQILNRGRIFD